MNFKLGKIAVGLALESEILNRRRNQRLFDLYRNPTLEGIRALYEELKNSACHYDREVAIWLSTVLDLSPKRLDVEDLLQEFREMEWLLYHMLEEVEMSQRQDLSDWMNFLVNAAHSIEDGWYIDAKLCMNLALEFSRKESIENIKQNPVLGYLINLLQIETLRRFQEIREMPSKLDIPEERLDVIVAIQEILIDLSSKYYLGDLEEHVSALLKYVIPKIRSSMNHLMRSDLDFTKGLEELRNLSGVLMEWEDPTTSEFARALSDKIASILSGSTIKD